MSVRFLIQKGLCQMKIYYILPLVIACVGCAGNGSFLTEDISHTDASLNETNCSSLPSYVLCGSPEAGTGFCAGVCCPSEAIPKGYCFAGSTCTAGVCYGEIPYVYFGAYQCNQALVDTDADLCSIYHPL